MLYQLLVTLKGINGDTFTMGLYGCKNVSVENELCRDAVGTANSDPFHSKYGPWKVVNSKWVG